VWIIAAVLILDGAFALLSAADTLANILGVFIIVVAAILSVKTKCLTTIIK
jgi:hypothetical protein